MALNRHFRRHFARFVMGISAISAGGLSPGENDPGLLGETVAGARRRERAIPIRVQFPALWHGKLQSKRRAWSAEVGDVAC